MGLTTPENLPYPDPGTTLTPLETHFAALAEAVQDGFDAIRTSTAPPVASDAARNALYPTPIQGNAVFRLDRGYTERYYGEYSSGGNPGGRTPADWYPDGVATLPEPVVTDVGSQTLTGTSVWGTLPWAGTNFIIPAPMWVDLSLQSWVAITGASNDGRADVIVSGATTVAAQSHGWGAIAYGTAASGTSKSEARKVVKLNAGTNTVRMSGYRFVANSGTFVLTQNTVTITPIRWA